MAQLSYHFWTFLEHNALYPSQLITSINTHWTGDKYAFLYVRIRECKVIKRNFPFSVIHVLVFLPDQSVEVRCQVTVYVRHIAWPVVRCQFLVDYQHIKAWTKWTTLCTEVCMHDDVIKWKHFPCYWQFVPVNSPVNSPHKGQWHGALMFTLICARINGWVNNCEAGDLRRHRAHYDFIIMERVQLTIHQHCFT